MPGGGCGCDVSRPADGGGGPPANHDESGLERGPPKRPAAAAAAAAAFVCAIRSNLFTFKCNVNIVTVNIIP